VIVIEGGVLKSALTVPDSSTTPSSTIPSPTVNNLVPSNPILHVRFNEEPEPIVIVPDFAV